MTAPPARVSGLAVLEIFVTDLDRAVRFYRDRLGFDVVEGSAPGVLLGVPGLSLYLEGGCERHAADPETTRISPAFAVESVRASHDALVGEGIPVVIPYRAFGDTFALFAIEDPDGNVLSFSGPP